MSLLEVIEKKLDELSERQTFSTMLSSINVSLDFSREAINELGRKGPYYTHVSFPVELIEEYELCPTTKAPLK